MAQLKRFLPLAVMLLAIVAAFALGLDDYLSLDQLERHRARLLDLVGAIRSGRRSRTC